MLRKFAGSLLRIGQQAVARHRERCSDTAEARVEAAQMIARHGPDAYLIARGWARSELLSGRYDPYRPAGHWQRVRTEIRRQLDRRE